MTWIPQHIKAWNMEYFYSWESLSTNPVIMNKKYQLSHSHSSPPYPNFPTSPSQITIVSWVSPVLELTHSAHYRDPRHPHFEQPSHPWRRHPSLPSAVFVSAPSFKGGRPESHHYKQQHITPVIHINTYNINTYTIQYSNTYAIHYNNTL